MKVLVLGASGFIGLPVAQALLRAGHIVYGVTRSEEKAKKLAAEEIIPIVARPTDTTWHSHIATLDAVIEAIGNAPDLEAVSSNVLSAVAQSAKTLRPLHAPKLTYIYTSGAWVHGDTGKEVVSDTTPIVTPVPLTAWRVAFEQQVVHNDTLNGIVIRPSLLYGRSGSITSMLFKTAAEGKVAWFGKPGGRYPTIHADDLADLYVRVAEKSQLVGGKIFDGANDCSESVDDLLQRLVEISGATGPEYLPATNPFHHALCTSQRLRPYLARALVGWSPRKPRLVDGLEVYYASFIASLDS